VLGFLSSVTGVDSGRPTPAKAYLCLRCFSADLSLYVNETDLIVYLQVVHGRRVVLAPAAIRNLISIIGLHYTETAAR